MRQVLGHGALLAKCNINVCLLVLAVHQDDFNLLALAFEGGFSSTSLPQWAAPFLLLHLKHLAHFGSGA